MMFSLRACFFLCAFAAILPFGATAADSNPWTYEDDGSWAQDSPANTACLTGTSQSPINISYTTTADLPKLVFDYHASSVHFEYKDHGMLANVEGKNTLTIEGTHYILKQVRFHSPSEHLINDTPHMMELQLVHENDKGQVLIVAVFVSLDEEADNPAMRTVSEHMPGQHTDEKPVTWDLASLIPGEPGYYSYSGSLTVPPCTEPVEWRVMKNPILMTTRQFQKIVDVLGRNARITQTIYMRTVLETR